MLTFDRAKARIFYIISDGTRTRLIFCDYAPAVPGWHIASGPHYTVTYAVTNGDKAHDR